MGQPLTAQGQAPPGFVPKFPQAAEPAPRATAAVVAPAPVAAPSAPFDPSVLVIPGLVVGLGMIVGVVALVLRRRAQRLEAEALFRVLGTRAEMAGAAHVEFTPVDLQRPIDGDDAWRAIRTHANDTAYLAAVEALRDRYGALGQPMVLSNMIYQMMARSRVGFREAVLRLAGQDTAQRPNRLLEYDPMTERFLDYDPRRDEPEAEEARIYEPPEHEAEASAPRA